MAIDTKAERESFISFGDFDVQMRSPDGGINSQGDRQTMEFLFAGFSSGGSPVVNPPSTGRFFFWRRKHR